MMWPASCVGPRVLAAALATALATAAVSGCGRSDKQRLDAARAYFDKRELASATIELKNVLQNNPGAGEARFLLGQTLFLAGDALGAEAEWRRALEAHHSADEVAPQLARAMVALQRFAPLIKEFAHTELGQPGAAAELKAQLAIAHMALGALDEAERVLQAAFQRAPGHRSAQEVLARLRAARGDAPAALAIAEQLLAKQPDDAPALALLADLLLQAAPAADPGTTPAATAPARRELAVAAYRKALALEPKLVQAHTGLISLHLSSREHEAARQQWQQLLALQPGHLQTRFYEAVLALQRGEPHHARELSQHLINRAPENPRLHLLAGQAELALGGWMQAETHLHKAVLLAPGLPEPRRALAAAYVQVGQPKRALEQLAPLTTVRSQDAEALALAGRAHLMAGDTASAEAAFARAEALNPALPGLRMGLALAQIGKGQPDAGLAALEAAAGGDPGTDADLALISMRLARKQYPAALAAIDALAPKAAGSPLPELLRGRAQLAQGHSAAARASWEAALAKSPQYLPALGALADLDSAAGKVEAARARFAAASQREPGNAALLLALADFTGRTGGGKAEVLALLRKAAAASPRDPEPRARLVDYALALADTGLALSEAQAAASALPEHAAVIERLGLAQQRAGDVQQATTTFGKLAQMQPRSAAAQLRLADTNLALGRHEVAAQQARRALELEPDNLLAHRAAAFAALRLNRRDDALALARAAQRRWPMPGMQLEAELEMAARNAEAGIAVLRRLLAAAPGHSEAAIQLHLALIAAGKANEAHTHAQAWMAQRPADHAFALHLGNLAASQGDFPRAQGRFEQILLREPQNIHALNNLAHVLAATRQPGAVALAERALKLAPNQPPLMDTLAFAKAAAGQVAEALALQKAVVELSPDEPEFRLSLARVQLQAGEREPARETLNLLAKRGNAFARQAEVSRMLAQLSAAGGAAAGSSVSAPPPAPAAPAVSTRAP